MNEQHQDPRRRRFPIIDGPSVLWSAIEPFEYQAQINHQQSLQRLAERGGLGSLEAWAVVNGWSLRKGMAAGNDEGRAQWRAFVAESDRVDGFAAGVAFHAAVVRAAVMAVLAPSQYTLRSAESIARDPGPYAHIVFARALLAALEPGGAVPDALSGLRERVGEILREHDITRARIESEDRADRDYYKAVGRSQLPPRIEERMCGALLAILQLIDGTGVQDGQA